MPSAARILIAAGCVAALAGCSRGPSSGQNQDLLVDENLPAGEVPPGAEIETLPADESSVTSNAELDRGDRNPEPDAPAKTH